MGIECSTLQIVNIIGYGITTKPIVELLNYYNIHCHIYDSKFLVDSAKQCELEHSMGICTEKNDKNCYYPLNDSINNNHIINSISIISPGINPNMPYLRFFNNIISEYDFVYFLLQHDKFIDRPYTIWISGTNGKTTTTEISTLLLQAKAGGNIGTPLVNLLDYKNLNNSIDYSLNMLFNYCINTQNINNNENQEKDKRCAKYLLPSSLHYQDTKQENNNYKNIMKANIWVLETSSFSLHWSNFAMPNLYILLPLSQDHISWHGSYENYIMDKINILDIMSKSGNAKNLFAIIPKDLYQYDFAKKIIDLANINIFAYKDSKHLCEYFAIPSKYANLFKEPFKLDFAMSVAGTSFAGIRTDISLIDKYKIGEYRIQERIHNNLLFINDSKGTNPHATLAAIKSYNIYNLYLILGGDAKGAKLNILYEYIKQHKIKVFSIGKDGKDIMLECQKLDIEAKFCKTLRQAMEEISKDLCTILQTGNEISNQNIAIMLSPACASIDQYPSYKQRGEEFWLLMREIF
ncbi:Mur ligase family protein [Helicobacter muridarum]|nr:Mur ligase family protein [Helicobacter muridarum]STQ85663.1 UDP-N-acetylmuramoylalanine--D-glutamate ligase [Helicobacter muridarum]